MDSDAGGEGASLDPPYSLSSRTLHYIPIIHTPADMGALGASLQRMKAATFGRQRLRHSADLVDKMWQNIERTVEALPVAAGQTRVYQDGLPVCGQELRIVSELAEAGSRNHKLLLSLHGKGAILMGTESPELLVEEYELTTAALNAPAGGDARRRQQWSATLLEKRDRYIAARINHTLQKGETGILFVGMLHAVQRYLEPDIRIVYPAQAVKEPWNRT